MTRAESWNLILRICDETRDEVIASVRLALLNDFGKTEEFCRGDNIRELARCFRSFVSPGQKSKAVTLAPPPGRPMIVFPGASGSNLLNLLPVAQEAHRRGKLGGIVAGNGFRSLPSNPLAEFQSVILENDLNNFAGIGFLPGSLNRAIKRLRNLIARLKGSGPHCARMVRLNYGSYLRLMVASERMAVAYKRLLSMWRPSIVLSTSDFWPAEFQACWQAKLLGIPTAILQHGAINDVCAWPTYHDVFLAWGEGFREQLLKQGAPGKQVKVVGMPASDDLFRRSQGKPTVAGRGVAPVCLIFSHTQDRVEDQALFREYGECLTTAIESTPDVLWRIRLHPSEDDCFYRELDLLRFKNVEMSPRELPLVQDVERASVVTTIRSTAGMQAMMMGKPLLIFYPASMSSPPVTWPNEGGGSCFRDAGEFKNNIQRLLDDERFLQSRLKAQNEFLEKSFSNCGRASAATVDFLEQYTLARRRKDEPVVAQS